MFKSLNSYSIIVLQTLGRQFGKENNRNRCQNYNRHHWTCIKRDANDLMYFIPLFFIVGDYLKSCL